MIRRIHFLLFLLLPVLSFSQVVFQDISYSNIYDFLDELANLRIITINSAVKPFSYQYIADKLNEAKQNQSNLTNREKDELTSFLNEYTFYSSVNPQKNEPHPLSANEKNWFGFGYDPPGFRFQKGLIKLALQPVFGIEYMTNKNRSVSYIEGGGKLYGNLGKHIGFWAGIINRRQSDSLVLPQYFSEMEGADWKSSGNRAFTNSELTGGVSVSWNWGDFGIYKERLVWGNNWHGANILSGRPPSFPFIQLHIRPAKWIEFSYIHGLLISNVIDSSRSTLEGNSTSIVYLHKYIAANLITIKPWKGFDFSLGNSSIYENEYPGVLYFIPFLFYNSADATLTAYNNNAGANHQLFIDLSSRNIKHLHLYCTLFVDEISLSNIFKPSKQSNLLSFKVGSHLTDFLIHNLSLIAEYTRSNPLVYKHFIPSTTFSSDEYCLGDFLRDNSQDLYVSLMFKPIKGLSCTLAYDNEEHGNEYQYTGPNRGFPFLKNIIWSQNQVSVRAAYQFFNKTSVFIAYQYTQNSGIVSYTPPIFLGNTNTVLTGLRIGY